MRAFFLSVFGLGFSFFQMQLTRFGVEKERKTKGQKQRKGAMERWAIGPITRRLSPYLNEQRTMETKNQWRTVQGNKSKEAGKQRATKKLCVVAFLFLGRRSERDIRVGFRAK
jgi:hypothetical protein